MSNTDGEDTQRTKEFFDDLRLKTIISKRNTMPSLKIQAVVFGVCWFILLVLITIALNIKNGIL